MYENSYKLFTDAGYVSIGMDHFSKPGDEFEIKLGRKQIRLTPVGATDEDDE